MKYNVFKKSFMLLVILAMAQLAKAQLPTCKLFVTNQLQTAPNVYQFDVYLLNTSSVQLRLANVQFAVYIDPAIKNGGTITASYRAGSTELNEAQAPVNVKFVNTVNYFNLAARPNPGSANASIISTENKGCTAPGTKVGTFVVTNSVNFTANATPNSVFSISQAAGRTNTLVSAYDAKGTPTVISLAENNIGWGMANSCFLNLPLNAAAIKK